MANPAHTDMIEEDAADLQFPKEFPLNEQEIDLVSIQKEEIFTSDPVCCTCKSTLIEPYIKCAQCKNTNLCPMCFSRGKEKNKHKNYHDYIIIKNEFPLIEDTNWTAKEELELLNSLQECGFGNWVDVSKRIPGKSAEECKSHYLNNYIDNRKLPDLPNIPENSASLFATESIPYAFKLQDLEEPPRFATGTANSRLLAGYNPARSDFGVNFDNYAELLVSELKYDEFGDDEKHDDDHHHLGRELQVAIVDSYNNRLRERKRRKAIIREHGLIAFRRTMSWLHRYDSTITRSIAERLLVFMQLVSGIDFDYILEGLHRAGELRDALRKLYDYRTNGLKHFHSIPIYKKLLALKSESDRERKLYVNNIDYSWKSIIPESFLTDTPVANTSMRKPPPPLDIRGLPFEDKLMAEEKELCISARIPPEQYLDHKKLLINENKKLGSLKLAQARTLLKIDVNRTKKLYVFLIEHGWIQSKSS